MKINTCYSVKITQQLNTAKDAHGKRVIVPGGHAVNGALMRRTADICLSALKYCVSVILAEWESLSGLTQVERRRRIDVLIHTTAGSIAKYPRFDEMFPNMPSYTRRAVIADAAGMVGSYHSSHRNWEALSPAERGAEPVLGFPPHYELTFYRQDRELAGLQNGEIGLKLYDGKTWGWHYFRIAGSDAAYISALSETRKMCSPSVYKKKGKYHIRFSFEEERSLVQDGDRLAYRILAVDLGIHAAASWCVMESDGTVHAKGVIRPACEEGRLNHAINRKRMYQQAGKKSRCVYRWVTEANRQLSIRTAKELADTAVRYNADCIVFEHLDSSGRIRGRRYRERIHMWRKCDIQDRVALQAHRLGMRISRVCAWGTSKYAFDGSGEVDRHSVYRYKHGRKVYNYSVCTFRNGKVYNCDLSASQNIGARFFLREYARRKDCPELPKTPQRTMSTLWDVVKTYSSCSAAKV